jgi:hypothetical protein
MDLNVKTLRSPGHGDLWTEDIRAIRAAAAFFTDTRMLSEKLCRDVDLSLKLALDLAGSIASDAWCLRIDHRSPETETWDRIEKDASAVRRTLLASEAVAVAEDLPHWWDAFSKLSRSLHLLAEMREDLSDPSPA